MFLHFLMVKTSLMLFDFSHYNTYIGKKLIILYSYLNTSRK